MRRNAVKLARTVLGGGRLCPNASLLQFETVKDPLPNAISKTLIPFNFITPTSTTNFSYCRTLSTSPEPSKMVLIKSEEEFNTALTKVEDESLPAIFYFTAVWCGPCRFISPVIEQLSEVYPHVTTYKIDIDQEGLESTLSKLNITAVPTLHFFQGGKKVAQVIGADVAQLKTTMEKLYKTG